MSPAYHYARKLAGMATAPVPIDRVKATETWLAAIAQSILSSATTG